MTITLHNLKNSTPRKSRKRVGRGTGNNWGRTCGRGDKGQKSRSGYSRKPYFEGGQIPLFRRLPKKGFNHPNRIVYAIVNVDDLNDGFETGNVVDHDSLREKGMIRKVNSGIKILGNGDITISLTVQANRFSKSAREKIEAAGGQCEVV